MAVDRGCWLIHLLLLCVWCSLDTGPLIMVNAQSVTIQKITPLGDVAEGDTVELQCDASNLQSGNAIEWSKSVMNTEVIIARNGVSLDSRYNIDTLTSSAQIRREVLTFNISKDDTSYTCWLKSSAGMNSDILTASDINLNVLYFPSGMYPICFPNGPFTVQEGTTQHMNCSTELGNPPVQIAIQTNSIIYIWMYLLTDTKQTRSLELTVSTANNDGSYECKITSTSAIFPGMERSCTIGPMTVVPMTTPSSITTIYNVPQTTDIQETATLIQVTSGQLTDSPEPSQQTHMDIPWMSGFIGCLIVFSINLIIVSLIINIFHVIRHRYLKNSNGKETNMPQPDPYMELQPTDDKNRVYMEPTVKETTTVQLTYYHPFEVENKSSENDYARPEKTNTS